jgi:multisubunit Na+/H+ antiporter MnhG subunit
MAANVSNVERIHIVGLAIPVLIRMNALKVVTVILIVLLINPIAVRQLANAKNAGVLRIALTVTHVKIMNAFGKVVLKTILNAL